MALAEGTTVGYPSTAAAAAIEGNRRKKKKHHRHIDSPGHARKSVHPRTRSVDIESIRASQSIRTPNQRRIAASLSKQRREDSALALLRALQPDTDALGRPVDRNYPSLGELAQARKIQQANVAAGSVRLLDRLGTDFGTAAIYSPAGIYEAGKGIGFDVRDIATGRDFTPSRTANLGKAIGEATAEDLRHPLRHPGYTLLDALSIASLGAGTAARVGAVGRAGTLGEAARAAIHPPIPERVFRVPGESGTLKVKGSYSRSALARYGQMAGDKAREAGYGGFGLRRSHEAKAGYELGQNLEMADRIERAPAIALQRVGKRLKPAEQTALRVVFEEQPIEQRIAHHQQMIREATKSSERIDHTIQVGLLRKARKYVDEHPALPDEAYLEAHPGERYLPVLVNQADAHDVRVGPPGAAHYEMPGSTDAKWIQGYAVIENGKIRRINFTPKAAASGDAETPYPFEQPPGPFERAARASVEKQLPRRPTLSAKASDRLRKAEKLVEENADRREEVLSALERLSPEQIESRLSGPGRIIEGGRYEEPSVAQLVREHEVPTERLTGTLVRAADDVPRFGKNIGRIQSIDGDTATVFFKNRKSGARATAELNLEDIRPLEPLPEHQGKIVGGESFEGGRARIPYERGTPALSLSAYIRGVQGSFGGLRKGQAIGFPNELPTVTKRFKGGLLLSGHFRNNVTHLTAEDYVKAQRFGAVLRGRDALERVAVNVPDDPRTAIPIRLGELKGKPLPTAVRDAIEAAEHNDLTRKAISDLDLQRDVEALRQQVFPDMTYDEFLRAKQLGSPEVKGIKWVDEQFFNESGLAAPPSVLVAATRKARGARTTLGVFDLINDASRIAILYLKPAYAIPNMLGNAALVMIHQGAFAPVNLAKSARLSAKLGDTGAAIVDSVMGEGLASVLRTEKLGQKAGARMAEIWGKAVDVPFRRAAFLHEARRAGYRTLADVKRLLEDESKRGELVQIARRANREIIDYSRLGPMERSIIRRVVFFYPWVKGATIYGARLPFEHPVQSQIIGQLGRQGEEKAKRDLGKLPAFARGTFKVGGSDKLPLTINPSSIAILQTPVETAEIPLGLLGLAKPSKSPEESLTPFLDAAVTTLSGYDAFRGQEVPRDLSTFGGQLYEGLPQKRAVEGIFFNDKGDREGKMYPDTPATAGARYGLGSAYPRAMNLDVAHERARLEGVEQMSRTERATQRVYTEREKTWQEAQRVGILEKGEKFSAPIKKAWDLQSQRWQLYAEADDEAGKRLSGKPLQLLRFTADMKLAVEIGAFTHDEAAAALRNAQGKTAGELEKWRADLNAMFFGGQVISDLGKAIREAGGEP